jgi:hypothetical protein
MSDSTFVIAFPSLSTDEANKCAAELADELTRDIVGIEKADPTRNREDTQDFGPTLVLVLGTAAATAVARGIQSYLARKGVSAELRKDGTVKLSNLRSEDVATIAKTFGQR